MLVTAAVLCYDKNKIDTDGGVNMQEYELSCFRGFVCLASECPDTCCQSWEVVLEPETLEKYHAMPGPLGEQIRDAIVTEGEDSYFELKGGFCPFLDASHLCKIQRQMGEGYLSDNCGSYPRFTEVYGGQRERCLALSCPEASRMLLSQSEPLKLVVTTTQELPEPNDLDPEQFFLLRKARRVAIEILQDRGLPWERREAVLLAFTDKIQKSLTGRHGDGHVACDEFSEAEVRKRMAGTLPRGGEMRAEILKQIRELFQEMEPLREQWQKALKQLPEKIGEGQVPDWQREHFLVYYLYRYFFKAINDGCLAPRIRGGILSDLLLCQMGALEAQWRLSNFSREVEHSEENMRYLIQQAGSARFAALERVLQ